MTLPETAQFREDPLRPYITADAGRFPREQLKYLSVARSNRATGGWGMFTPEWWTEMEANTIEALTASKAAIDETNTRGEEWQ